MFIEQLRCDYDVTELFQEERILGPTEPTVDSGLCTDTVSTMIDVVMGLLRSRCYGCAPRHPLLEETPE